MSGKLTTNHSHCIVVLSLPRSGSSLVAGCLHRLGVEMGEGHLQRPDTNNPTGYYEDLRWQRITKSLAGRTRGGYDSRRVWTLPERQAREYDTLAQTCAQVVLWGMKGPDMAFVFQHVHPILARYAEVRVVQVQRDREAAIQSLMAHSRRAYHRRYTLTRSQAEKVLARWDEALQAGLGTFDGPTYEVQFEDVIADPTTEIAYLVQFVFAGNYERCKGLREAVDFVDEKLQHHGRTSERVLFIDRDPHVQAAQAAGRVQSIDRATDR